MGTYQLLISILLLISLVNQFFNLIKIHFKRFLIPIIIIIKARKSAIIGRILLYGDFGHPRKSNIPSWAHIHLINEALIWQNVRSKIPIHMINSLWIRVRITCVILFFFFLTKTKRVSKQLDKKPWHFPCFSHSHSDENTHSHLIIHFKTVRSKVTCNKS